MPAPTANISGLELLAPAGGKDSFEAALKYGADALYLGLSAFSARDKAENFNKDNLAFYVDKAHKKGVKVYVALNTLIADREMQSFLEQAKTAYAAGADALIIQELRLVSLLKKAFPQIEIHLSTQGGTCNKVGALLAKEYGASRVILARESKLSDIKEIAKVIDAEVFVQGALCASFSGQCLFSSAAGDASGNRGQCRQPCRKLYSLGGGSLKYALSPSDLYLKDNLEELKSAGVKSLKIEGRLRSAHYVASAVNFYAKALRGKESQKDLVLMKRNFYRGYTQGLSFYEQKDFLSPFNAHRGQSVGKVISVYGNMLKVQSKEVFCKDSAFKVFSRGKESASAAADEKGNIYFLGKVKANDQLFITKDASSLTLAPLEIKREKIVRELPKESYEKEVFSSVLIIDKNTPPFSQKAEGQKRRIAVISGSFKELGGLYDIAVFAPENYFDQKEYQSFFEQTYGKEKYLYLPAYAEGEDLKKIKSLIAPFDGIYCQGYYGEKYAKDLGVNFFAGTGNNIYNSFDLAALKGKCKYAAISLESSAIQAKDMLKADENAFLTVFGAFEIMQLIFCPFGKNCKGCKAQELSVLKDERGREFLLKKYQMGSCRFSLFNSSPILCRWEGNAIVNALTLDKDKVKQYLASGLNYLKGKELFPNYTSFHRLKPLPALAKK